MAKVTRIGVGFSSNGLTPGEIVEYVRRAEDLGYESARVAEGHGSVFVRSAPSIALPIVTPRGGGPDPKARVVAAISTCAP